jgi:hypothetical protein
MDKRNDDVLRKRAREEAVYRYTSALERGDFETVVAMLAQAEQDAELERMIVEVNEVLAAEHEVAAAEHDAAQVRTLLHEHLPSGFASDDEVAELPPLTIAAVVALMSEDAAQRGQVTQELATLTRRLAAEPRPMPEDLSLGAVRQLFSELEISASAALVKQFRAAAIYLAEGREHGQAYQAAARRQHELRRTSKGAQPRQPNTHRGKQEEKEEERP